MHYNSTNLNTYVLLSILFFISGVSLSVTAVEVAEQLDNMQYSLSQNFELWNVINKWTNVKQIWINTPIESLKIDQINQYIQKIQEITFFIESGRYTISICMYLCILGYYIIYIRVCYLVTENLLCRHTDIFQIIVLKYSMPHNFFVLSNSHIIRDAVKQWLPVNNCTITYLLVNLLIFQSVFSEVAQNIIPVQQWSLKGFNLIK